MIGCCEGEVRDCCLKSYWVIYFSNMLWDHIPDANCSGVKGKRCSVDGLVVVWIWANCNEHEHLLYSLI